MANRFFNNPYKVTADSRPFLAQNAIQAHQLEQVCDKIEEVLLPLQAKVQVMEAVLKENGIEIPEDHFQAAMTLNRAAEQQEGRSGRAR